MNNEQELRPDYYKVFIEREVKVAGGNLDTFVTVRIEIQPFDVIRALGLSFFEGSLLKYLWRKDKKSQDPEERVRDARKVLTYAQQALVDAISARDKVK